MNNSDALSSKVKGSAPATAEPAVTLRNAIILSQIKDAIICADPDGIVTFWNEAAFDIWGWSAEEMLGRSVFDRLPEGEGRDWGRQRFAAILGGEESYGDRLDYRKDGSRIWLEVRSTCLKDPQGIPQGILTIARDISARRQAEEKLRQSEALMAAAQRLAHFGAWELDLMSTDVDANSLHWSDECYRIFGYEPGSVKASNELFFKCIPAEDHESIRRAVAKAVAERGVYSVDHRIVRPDGELRHVREQAQVFVDENTGRLLKMVGTVQDITERKQAEQALQESEQQFRLAMEHSSIGMALVAPTGRWHRVNQALCRIVGYTEAELLATDFQSITHPDDLVADLELMRQLSAGVIQTYQMEKRYFHKQGNLVWILLSVSVVRDPAGQPQYFISQIQDITQRKQAMEELVTAKEAAEAAAHAKSEFLAMISHEIRTPLNPVLGAVQLLMDQECAPEQRELLQVIHNAGEHLLTLLNDILDLAKTEASGAKPSLNPCRLQDLVQGVFEIKREEVRAKQLALGAEYHEELAFCYHLDEPRLRQILLNLIGNAVKFTNQGGVTVKIERLANENERDHLRFNVCDSGIGLRPEDASRIFEPFYQVDSSPKRRYEGAGLGLAICQRLIHMMGGEIGVASRFSAGSTFWFTVWLERRRSLEGSGTPWPMPVKSTQRRHILLVNSAEQDRLLLTTVLERAECEVTPAATAADAIARFQPGVYHLVLVDELLPNLGYEEVVTTLRERESRAGVPATAIFLQSSRAGEADVRAAEKAGFTGLLAKPVRQVELMRLLARHAPLPPTTGKRKMKPPTVDHSGIG